MDELLDVFRGRLTVGREAKGVDGVEDADDIEDARVRDVVVVVGVWVAEVDGLVEEEDEEVVDIVVVVGFVGTREGCRSIAIEQ
ncbi:MAG: hypothetical protein CL902_00325 [Dehalococcoidia bacterium]|nr:hypothetical protein [Dehalococcoidia bacterium]